MSLYAAKWTDLDFKPLAWPEFRQSSCTKALSVTPFSRSSFETTEESKPQFLSKMKLQPEGSLLDKRGFYDHFDRIFHDTTRPIGSCDFSCKSHQEAPHAVGNQQNSKPEGKEYYIPIKIDCVTASETNTQKSPSSEKLHGALERVSALPGSKYLPASGENCLVTKIPVNTNLKERFAERSDCQGRQNEKATENSRYSAPSNFRLLNPATKDQRCEQPNCRPSDEKENVISDVIMDVDYFFPSPSKRQLESPSSFGLSPKFVGSLQVLENFKVEETAEEQSTKTLLSSSSLRRKPLRQLYDDTATTTSIKPSCGTRSAPVQLSESKLSLSGSNVSQREVLTSPQSNDVFLDDVICSSSEVTAVEKDGDTAGGAVSQGRCCAAGVSVATPPPGYSVYKYLKPTLASVERQVDYIKGDGNCFFRALSKEVYGSENFHAEWREAVVDVIECHPNVFQQYIDTSSVAAHVKDMRKLGMWATTCEIYAAATLLHRNIYVLAPDHNHKEYRWLLFSPRQLTGPSAGSSVCPFDTHVQTRSGRGGSSGRSRNRSSSGTSRTLHPCYLTLCHTNGNHYDRIMPVFASCNCELPPPSLDGVTVLVDLTESDEDRE